MLNNSQGQRTRLFWVRMIAKLAEASAAAAALSAESDLWRRLKTIFIHLLSNHLRYGFQFAPFLCFRQIWFLFKTNMLCVSDKYTLCFRQIYFVFQTNMFVFKTNMLCAPDKYVWDQSEIRSTALRSNSQLCRKLLPTFSHYPRQKVLDANCQPTYFAFLNSFSHEMLTFKPWLRERERLIVSW